MILTAQQAEIREARSSQFYQPPLIVHSVDNRDQSPNSSSTLEINPSDNATTEAMWDLQFLHSPGDSVPGIKDVPGLAGAVWTGTDFWVSTWDKDTILRLDGNGVFQEVITINTISGVRGMTWDGSLIYTSNNSNLLRGIDPQTKQIVNTIALSGGISARFAAYDSLADNGNGGFYVGNFNTDIYLVNMMGQRIDTIPFATHARPTIYGAVVDNTSPGGPFLWVFDQPEFPSYGVISQLKLPDGTYTGFSRDVHADIPLQLGAAGGLFIGENIVPGQFTLGGIFQDNIENGVLFGYDLDHLTRQTDAGVISLFYNPRYTTFPLAHSEINFQGLVSNTGTDTLLDLQVDIHIRNANDSLVSNQTFNFDSVPNYQIETFQVNPWIPTKSGTYRVSAITSTGSQFDEFSLNDSLDILVHISDSVYARDDGFIINDISANTPGQHSILGQNFTLKEPDYITSVSFTLVKPDSAMTIAASIYGVNPPIGIPNQNIYYGRTILYDVTPTDMKKGAVLNLPLDSVPILLPAGEFYIGVNQPINKKLSLGVTFDRFTPAKTWSRGIGGAWMNNEDLGASFPYALRPNFGPCYPTYMSVKTQFTDDTGAGDGTAVAIASGASGPYTYLWNDPFAQTTPIAINLVGGTPYSCIVRDVNGCEIIATTDTIPNNVSIDDWEKVGITEFNLFPNPAKDAFNVNILFKQPMDYSFELLDLKGRKIYQKRFFREINNQSIIDISNLSSGMYLFKLKTKSGVIIRKVAITP